MSSMAYNVRGGLCSPSHPSYFQSGTAKQKAATAVLLLPYSMIRYHCSSTAIFLLAIPKSRPEDIVDVESKRGAEVYAE